MLFDLFVLRRRFPPPLSAASLRRRSPPPLSPVTCRASPIPCRRVPCFHSSPGFFPPSPAMFLPVACHVSPIACRRMRCFPHRPAFLTVACHVSARRLQCSPHRLPSRAALPPIARLFSRRRLHCFIIKTKICVCARNCHSECESVSRVHTLTLSHARTLTRSHAHTLTRSPAHTSGLRPTAPPLLEQLDFAAEWRVALVAQCSRQLSTQPPP